MVQQPSRIEVRTPRRLARDDAATLDRLIGLKIEG
jgi:hypothetical protein